MLWEVDVHLKDARGDHAPRQRALRVAEALPVVGAQPVRIAKQVGAGFRIAEAIAALEREVAFVGRDELDQDHVAPRRRHESRT